jgi:hypothetical protein
MTPTAANPERARPSASARPAQRPGLWLAATAALSVLALAGAGLGLAAYADPGGGVASVAPLAAVDEARAAQLLNQPQPGAAQIRRAEAAARSALRKAPTHAAAWLELAYADALRHGRLTPAGLVALRRSYDFEPLGPEVSPWRIRFVAEHWTEVGPELRRESIKETEALWTAAGGREVLTALPQKISNTSGRLSLTLTVARLTAAASR